MSASITESIKHLNELLCQLETKLKSESSLKSYCMELTSLLNDSAFSLPVRESVTKALSNGLKQTRKTKLLLNNEETHVPQSIFNSETALKTPKNPQQFGPSKRRKVKLNNNNNKKKKKERQFIYFFFVL